MSETVTCNIDMYKEIGRRIEFFRKEKGWTQQVLAEKVNLRRPSISLIESGSTRTPIHRLYHFARALNVNINHLITDDNNSIIYNSEADTLKHIKRVSELLTNSAKILIDRAISHDDSKLSPREKPYFDEFTPKLANCTYGSEEYKNYLKSLNIALDHHYRNNSHHPEHYKNGINDMNLFDIIEMFLDWKAATERHNDGDIYKSIEINKDRFKISNQLSLIFLNTARFLGFKK